MSRPVAGLACRIRIPVRHYQAVAVVACATSHAIRLMHRDPAFSIDVEEFGTLETAEDYCDRLARFLDLPTLTIAAGLPSDGDAAVGSLPQPRRNVAYRKRRPRFLARRRAGRIAAIVRIEGREIIART